MSCYDIVHPMNKLAALLLFIVSNIISAGNETRPTAKEEAAETKLNKEKEPLPARVTQLRLMLHVLSDTKQLKENAFKRPLTAEWPKEFGGLFQGIRMKVDVKVTNKEEHLKAAASIPKPLMKGYKIGKTIEVDGWYYSCVVKEDVKEIKDHHWWHTLATKKGESFLQFGFTW